MITELDSASVRRITMRLAIIGVGWALAVAFAAASGLLRAIYPPLIGPMVALGIALPTAAYFLSPTLKAYFNTIGLYPITVFHIWRIPAALTFFWFGLHGDLPPLFWTLAGTGDLLAGLMVLPLLKGPVSTNVYWNKHLFGFADFVIAVGTGLTYTLLHDPRMGPVRDLPLALIPLFGVGISGASHLIAFDLLSKRRGAKASVQAIAA